MLCSWDWCRTPDTYRTCTAECGNMTTKHVRPRFHRRAMNVQTFVYNAGVVELLTWDSPTAIAYTEYLHMLRTVLDCQKHVQNFPVTGFCTCIRIRPIRETFQRSTSPNIPVWNVPTLNDGASPPRVPHTLGNNPKAGTIDAITA